MFSRLLILSALISCWLQAAQAAVIVKPDLLNEKKPWELIEAIYATQSLRSSFNGTWITANEFYYKSSQGAINLYNAATKTPSVLVPVEDLTEYKSGSTFSLSPDNKKLLVRFDVQQIFRHSFKARYNVFDIETKKSTQIHDGDYLQYCAWSTIKDRLAYVYNSNVYVHMEDGSKLQLTTDGVDGVVYYGIPDWVYEEEVLSSGSAMWWSPDGQKLAIGVFNDTFVKTFQYAIYGEASDPNYQYPKEEHLKYPKPGSPNPMVALRVYDLSQSTLQPVTLSAPINIVTDDHILQNTVWANNNEILVTWLNRRQNKASMQLCSLTGSCNEVEHLEEPKGWIKMSTPKCLSSGKNCIFTHWIGNWYQIWNLNLETGQNMWKSRGDFTVLNLYGYDESNDKVYYQAHLKGNPHIYHVFANDDCLTCQLKDSEGELCLTASASFSKDYSYYSAVCAGPGANFIKVFKTDTNEEVMDWENNHAFRQLVAEKVFPTLRFMNVTLADNSTSVVRLKLPPNMDESKRYPMIVEVYGGPDSVRVTANYKIAFETYMVTTRNVIWAIIDGRGTGNKGKDFLFSVNNNLGQHEVEDQLFVTKHLQDTLPYVDRERTGIWGWSYGGYVSAKTIGSDSERVFQCGVSVAPVTSWIYYDTIYTERYMGLPTVEDNLAKYSESSVLQNIENFRNHDFLLIHGSGDDNVHYQQSLMLAKVLQTNDVLFEEMTYTDENHSIGNFLPHLYNTMDHFWTSCLNVEIDEDEINEN